MPLEYLWARSPCRRPVRSPPSPREDAPEVPVSKVAVPKTVRRPSSPRRDAPGALVGKVAVPKTGQKPPSPREDATGVPVGKVPVPMDLPYTLSGPRPAE
ncbi:MAG: hypothetical protein ACI39T_03760 [Candidatus Cryptobacteroides sp.]